MKFNKYKHTQEVQIQDNTDLTSSVLAASISGRAGEWASSACPYAWLIDTPEFLCLEEAIEF